MGRGVLRIPQHQGPPGAHGSQDLVVGAELDRWDGDAPSALDDVEDVNLACRLVEPVDRDVVARKQRAQPLAHHLDDGLEVELRGHALLDVVDDRQLAGTLLGLRLRCSGFCGAHSHLRFQAGREAQVVQRHGGLRGQHRQQVAVGVIEAAERAFDVGVDETEQAVLRHQRRDQARALVHRCGAFGAVAQAHGAGVARLGKPGLDGTQQRLRVFAARHQRAGDAQPVRTFIQHQQHALGATEFGHFVDQEIVQLGGAAQSVQAHAGVDQALERFDEVALDLQVRQPLRLGQRAPR